ncbi:hypothetical protein CDAR_419341, partial [Caerostris darwini]
LSLSLSLLFALLHSLSKDKEERNCLNNSDIQKNKKRTFRLSIHLRVVDPTPHKRTLFSPLNSRLIAAHSIRKRKNKARQGLERKRLRALKLSS